GWPCDWSRREVPALRRGSDAGRRLVRRRGVHGSGGALRPGHGCAGRLAFIALSAPARPPPSVDDYSGSADGDVVRQRRGPEPGDLDSLDARGCPRSPANGRITTRLVGLRAEG